MRIKHKTIVRPVAPSTTRPTQPPTPTPAPAAGPVAPQARVLSAFRWPEPHEHHRDSDTERTFGQLWDAGRVTWIDDIPVVA